LFVLALVLVSAAAAPDVSNEDDDFSHVQQVIDGGVTGEYRWEDDGVEYFVKYVADGDGYRVLESNAIPATASGVRADGAQGAFHSYEDDHSPEDNTNERF